MNEIIPISNIITQLSESVDNAGLLGASNDIEAIAIWLREYKDNINTLTSYRQCVERYYLWVYYRGKQLNSITREDLLLAQSENVTHFSKWKMSPLLH